MVKLIEVIKKIQIRLNTDLTIGGVFITQYDHRKILNKNVSETIKDHFKNKVFKTKIRDNIAIAEAPSKGLDIFRYNSKCYGAKDYLSLCKEIVKNKQSKH